MNTVYTDTLISTLLTDDELPSDYIEHPEEYFVPLSNNNAKKCTKSHLEDNSAGYVPGVVLLRNEETFILNFKHETADVISTWVELLALTRSCYAGSERLTFIFDTPYELSMDEKNDFFVLTVHDRSHVKGTAKSYSLHKSSFVKEILRGATVAYEFFKDITKSADLEELEDNIIFLRNLCSSTIND